MATTLQELRKEAGYRTAKDFAEAIKVPPTTYARYEQSPEKIPLKQAWMIADFLHCSIDAIVGREPIDVDSMRGEMQIFYDGLSNASKDLFNDFKEFIEAKEQKAAKRKQAAENRKYQQLAQRYETDFVHEKERSVPFGEYVFFDSPKQAREEFEDYLSERARIQREEDIEEICGSLEYQLRNDLTYVPGDDEGDEGYYVQEDVLPDEEIQALVEDERQGKLEEYEARDEEVISKIMAAYDRLHEFDDPDVRYYIVGLS